MLSEKILVRNLVEICAAKGIEYVLISPGSRNAPLNIAFNEDGRFKCLSIPDERVAAFVALGIGQQTGQPALISCTSGSAVLNYAPAISEAFYQQIPLLVLTADRPAEWVDQGNGQTIRQSNVFNNYIKKSYDLPTEPQHPNDLWHANRMIAEAIDQTTFYGVPGPVHLNIPFREPLYNLRDYTDVPLPKISQTVPTENRLQLNEINHLGQIWNNSKRVLILTGVLPPNPALNHLLIQLYEKTPSVVILTETSSNLYHPNFCGNIDRIIDTFSAQELQAFQPDLLVTIGHSIVSKKIKALLRKQPPKNMWHIGEEGFHLDTFQSLTHHLPIKPLTFFNQIFETVQPTTSNYQSLWHKRNEATRKGHEAFITTCEWSDMKAFAHILKQLPTSTNLQMGNSSPVRYIQLFNQRPDIRYDANRGVAGIDGSTSTAVGAALVNNRPTTVITGDIAFLYDSNAFWNLHLTENLRVIVINNGGGGIFRIIPGPDSTQQLEQFFETHHQFESKHLAALFGIHHFVAENETELSGILPKFYAPQPDGKPAILEVKTPRLINDKVLKRYFDFLLKWVSP